MRRDVGVSIKKYYIYTLVIMICRHCNNDKKCLTVIQHNTSNKVIR